MLKSKPRLVDATRTAAGLAGFSRGQRLLSASMLLTAGAAPLRALASSWPNAQVNSAMQHALVPHTSTTLTHALLSNGSGSFQTATSHTLPVGSSLHFALPSTASHGGYTGRVAPGPTAANSAQDLNLASLVPQFAAGSLAGFHSITIDVGGKLENIDFNTRLTGAELVAAQQVLGNGKQTLTLNASGAASGGSFNLDLKTVGAIDTALGGNIQSLDIAHGVTAVDTLGNLNLVGALINSGTLELGAALSAKSQSIDTISAANIYNYSGGTIGSASGIAGVKATDIALNAANSFVNQGSIVSHHDLNVTTANLTNSGTLKATSGNINLSAGNSASGLTVTSTGGTVEDDHGNINFASAGDITVNGGNFLSKQLNFDTPSGTVNANIGQVTGIINGTVGASHITAATDNLKLGALSNSGDPTYYNTAGDITIDSTVSATSGQDLAIVASGNIIANGGKIDTTATGGGKSGNVTLIAGAAFTPPADPITGTLTVIGAGTGGYIDLSGTTLGTAKGSPLTAITTASTNGNSGNIVMVAYQGSGTGGKGGGGSIVATALGTKGATTIDTTHGAGGSGGDVTIIGNGYAVQAQNIKTTNANVIVAGAAPVISNGPLTIVNGTVTGGSYSAGSATPTIVSLGTVTAGNITVTSGGNIATTKTGSLNASDAITLNAANAGSATAPLTTNAAQALNINGLSADPIYISEISGTALVSGSSTVGGQSITINETKTTLSVDHLNFTDVTLTNKTVGGNINLNPNGVVGSLVGEIYATGSTLATPADALGTGTITITAAGNITQGGTAANPNTAPVIAGKTVILNSTAGSIGDNVTGQSVYINAANLTANAAKGNVFISDGVQTTLSAGTASPTSGTYAVTGSGLAVAGVINAANIALSSGPGTIAGGPGTVLAINANIGSSKTESVTLTASGGILQQNSKAIAEAALVTLTDTESGDIGSSLQPIQTKALSTLLITNLSPSGTSGNNTFITQNGAVTLSNVSVADNLTLTVNAALTINGSTGMDLNFNNLTLTAPTLLIGSNTNLSITNFTMQSAGALVIAGIAASKTAPASTGQLSVGNNLALTGLNGGTATSVTIGDGKTGDLNPFGVQLAVGSLTVNTKGNFTTSSSQTLIAGDSLNITAGNLLNSDKTYAGPLSFGVDGINTSTTFNITGSQAVTFGNAAGNLQINNTRASGPILIASKGALAFDGSSLNTPTGQNGVDLTLNSSKLTLGVADSVNLNVRNLTIISPTISVSSGSTVSAYGDTTFTAKGALSITGAGTIATGANLTLGSTAVTVGSVTTNYVTTGITLGAAVGGAGNPLAAAFGSRTTGTLDNLTIATTGNFTSSTNGFTLNSAAPGVIDVTAANLINSTVTKTAPATATYLFNVNGVGVAPGTVNLTFTGSQAVTMGNDPGYFQVSAQTDQASGGGIVDVTSKGSLTTTFHSVLADTSANLTLALVSTGGSFIEHTAGSTSFVTIGAGANLTLSGAKGISIADEGLTNTNISDLTLISGATTPLSIGATDPKSLANGIASTIGPYNRGTNTSNLESVNISTGGGISFVNTGSLTMASNGVLVLYSSGQETILGADNAIQPGIAIGISGAKGITLGTPNPQGDKNPFSFLSTPGNSVRQLTIETGGVFAAALGSIYINTTGQPAAPNLMAAQTQSFAIKANAGSNQTVDPFQRVQDEVNKQLFEHNAVLNLNAPMTNDDFGSSVDLATAIILGFSVNPFFVPAANTQGVRPQTATLPNLVSITLTGKQAVTLGANNLATVPTYLISVDKSAPTDIFFSAGGNVTVGDSKGAGISTAQDGTVSIVSGGSLIVKSGGIAATGATALNLAGAKSLAVLDQTLLNGAQLTSVSLASTGTFTIGASGTFTNGTAGSIAAPSVSIFATTLVNNINSTIDGVGAGSTLTIGSQTGPFTVSTTGTGFYGTTTPFTTVNVISPGNINLGNLFSTSQLLGMGTVSNVSISTAFNLAAPAGTITFGPAGGGAITVGADSDGNAGSITLNAKSLIFAPTVGNNFINLDASTTGTNNVAGSITVSTTSALTIGANKGNVAVNVNGTASGGSVNLTSMAGALTISTELDSGTATLRGNNIILGQSVFAGSILDVGTNGKAGTGTITEAASMTINAPQLVIGQGVTKLSTTPLQVVSSNLTLAGGAFNINNAVSGGLTISALQPLAALTLNNTSFNSGQTVTINGISTTAGALNITVNGDGATLALSAGSALSAVGGGVNLIANGSSGHSSTITVGDGASIKATNGSITLLNNSNTGDGVINIGQNVNIYASGTVAGVGQVSIVNGDSVPAAAALIAGVTPGTASTTPTMIQTVGGNIYYGTVGNTGETISITNGGNTLSALGRNIVLNEGFGGGTITLAGADSITADPPIAAPITAAITAPITAASNAATTASALPAASTPLFANVGLSASSLAATMATTPQLALSALVSVARSPGLSQSIDAGALSNGKTPANISTFTDHSMDATVVGKNVLRASLRASAAQSLTNGVSLFSPEQDTVINTDSGSVSVAANSVVLIMAFDGGVAVYNMHDSKRDAVSIKTADHTFTLTPGRSAVITNRPISCFEEINPVQSVGYRSMVGKDLGGGLKSFQSEFNIVSLLQSAEPLQKFVASKDSKQQKASRAMLKTAAILSQLTGSQPYAQMTVRPVTAMTGVQNHW